MSQRNTHDAEEVQRSIDAHLDAIDNVLLKEGMSRTERQAITDEIASQIREILNERHGPSPDAVRVRAIIAELDPPEAYQASAEQRSAPAAAQEKAEPAVIRSVRIQSILAATFVVLGWGVLIANITINHHLRTSATPTANGGLCYPQLSLIPWFMIFELLGIGLGYRARKTLAGQFGIAAGVISLVLAPLFMS